MKHNPTTIADLLWLTTMCAFMCYLWLVADSRQVQFKGQFALLPPNDDALVQWLRDCGWTVDEVYRDDSAEAITGTASSTAQSLCVVARNNYVSDGHFSPPWEELGYKRMQLQGIFTHPEPARIMLFFMFWFAASIPSMIRWLRHRVRTRNSVPRAAE